MSSPRDRYITVFGRRPVLEVLADAELRVAKVLVADNARGPEIGEIQQLANRRNIECRRVDPRDVTRVSRNGRQDQGVVADVEAPRMRALDDWLESAPAVATAVVLDGITNPQNVGMILRAATGAGVDGVVVPTAGVADIGPLVIKASAGVAFRAPIIRTRSASVAIEALRSAGFRIYGLDAAGARGLFDHHPFGDRSAFVLGGEHSGLTVDVDETVSIPMSAGVDSLNVAVAAGVVCFEVVRRRL
ncbi:MAG TPA: RNA methyltransferase [Acidimicrobiales bacterium]|nr:RNA methyltransferase [Acidimicrobiales bacterium]